MNIGMIFFADQSQEQLQSLAAWAVELCPAARPQALVLGGVGSLELPQSLRSIVRLDGAHPAEYPDPWLPYAAAGDWAASAGLDLILLPAGQDTDAIAPSLALALGGCHLCGVSGLTASPDGGVEVVRSICSLELEGRFTLPHGPVVLTMAPHPNAHTVPVVRAEPTSWGGADFARAQWLRDFRCLPPTAAASLASADTVLVAGRGLGRHNLKKLEQLARRLGGQIAATRPVVLEGLISLSALVGASAMVIAPKVCLVFGASGAAAFMTGVERSALLVGVNTDTQAPIFDYCTLGVPADCGALLDALLILTEREEAT